jgi:class 3 adenylate cyclase/predicted ATPase
VAAIEGWLATLGLGEYAPRFAENDIDFTILSELTDQDLEKIGVASLGHRRKILRAIAELNGAPAATPPSVAPAPAPPPRPAATPTVAAEAAGERRYLTVMFCDLVDSTGISARLDAEEWRDLVGAYLDAASAAVTEMGGRVAKKLGDGLLALFGYPAAQENDAERAARAALSIQRALAELNRKNEGTAKPVLAARIGLETGPAVVDAAGEIYGDVANIAARVQALAAPGTVLVTARVQRQIAGLFVVEERGSHALKGVPEPTALFRLVRASGGGRRAGQRQLTPLVGRDDEMTMLLRRWERARQGDGQLVMIVGEPGLGKSRLIEEFHARLSDTPHTWVEWSCSQLLQNTPLHPIAEWGRARFGGADAPAERRLTELESSLAQVKLDPAENASLLAPLLDIPLSRERMPALAGEELRRRQLAALTGWVMAGAKAQPLVLAFEDLHWADPTTLDVLRGIAERGALAPLFIVATTRPEFRPPWSMRSHHGTISLAPLDRAQVRDMVAELSARHALPREVVEDVAARTGGVPLFVEEVTRLLLDRGEQGGGIAAIPPTLQQSLMARLDRLGPAREVAQIGAVIGRGFSYALLRDVAGMEHASLQAALEKLAEADILLVQGLPPESDYRFKHALIQDAAYENLLKSRRLVLHRRVAEILRDRFADTAAAEPEVLAHHFTQAGLTDAAIEWWGKAGDQALRRSAFQEAISHLGKAIEMADKSAEGAPRAAGPSPALSSDRLKLQTVYGQALTWAKGFGAEETKAAFTRARDLAAGIGDPVERFATDYGLWIGSLMRGELKFACASAESFLREAEVGGWLTEAVVARRNLGTACLFQGDFAEAKTQLEQALATYDPERDREAKFRFGMDSGVGAASYLALTHWLLGEVGRARELIEEAVARAIESAHPPTLAIAHNYKAVFELLCGDAAAAKRHADEAIQLSREHGIPFFLSAGGQASAAAAARLGGRGTAAVESRRLSAEYSEAGYKFLAPFYQGLQAELEAAGEEGTDYGLTRVDQAIALAVETGEHWTDALLHRIRGEILLKRDPANTAPAEEAFLTAVAIAQEQKAKSFELRAALSLAKLYQSTNRAAEAHAVLAPALEGFAPTPEFPEIEEAQTLLTALAGSEEVKNTAASRQRRLKLQTSYGQAMLHARGYSAPETTAAFARARELTAGIADPAERFSVYFGLWAGSFVGGDLAATREITDIMLAETKERPDSPEAGTAIRLDGNAHWMAGNFVMARDQLERALAMFDPERDADLVVRFAQDVGVAIRAYLALALWPLGEVDRARKIAGEMMAGATQIGHVGSIVYGHTHVATLELMRLDPLAAGRHSEALVELARAHEMPMFAAYGAFYGSWSRLPSVDREIGLTDMRAAIAACRERGIGLNVPYFVAALAEAEARAGELDAALATIDGAIADIERDGQRWSEAEACRVRGEILLKREPANTAPAEEAFLTAIAVAQQQKAKSFELRAALALAKLYQSSGRAADAHAVLAPALEGFTPTPEFPEIEEAQSLLAALAESDEVKNAAASRQRRLKLQTSYSQAMMHLRGHGAPETAAAFARAAELAARVESAAEDFPARYGLWTGSYVRGEPVAMRELSAAFLRDAHRAPGAPEIVIGHRIVGISLRSEGDYVGAREHLEQALASYDAEQHGALAFRFGVDTRVSCMVYLALALWPLGEVARARLLAEEALVCAKATGHVATIAYALGHVCNLDLLSRNATRLLPHAEALVGLTREHELQMWLAIGTFELGCAHWYDGARDAGERQMLAGIGMCREQGLGMELQLFESTYAEVQSKMDRTDAALATLDGAFALSEQTGQHWHDAELNRLRGDMLLRGAQPDQAAAAAAFTRAITIARQQKAKSFELRAALSLAKLYQSTNRASDAHAVLSSALAGFAPTPEFPEIEEAQTLLASLKT